MKTAITISLLALLAIMGIGLSGAGPRMSPPREKLSDYGFFRAPLSGLEPEPGVIPYDLNTPLFSNYAEKLRFIYIPAGKKGHYRADRVFDLPVGTVIIKNFYYPVDFRQPSKGRRILETRLLIREETGWNALPYIWNENQTEAYYDVAGFTRRVEYINQRGKKVSAQYVIPNKNQCKGCHLSANQLQPIGIAARHLNKPFPYPGGTMNQLAYWAENNLLSGLPDSALPANVNWEDETRPLEQRARAYLDINCGHCHHAEGPANTSGLLLDIHNQNPTALGIRKTPVAAGRGSGNLDYAILPGRPEKSILVYRMNTTDPGIAMPEIGREQIHREGLELISQWIRQLKD